MRTFFKQGLFLAAFAVFCMGGSLFADTGESYGCSASASPFAGYKRSTCQTSLFNYGGHLESGLYVNQYGQKNSYTVRSLENSRLGVDHFSGNTSLLQNVGQSDLQMNQMMFFMEKQRRKCGWDWGGRVDYIYGTDARYLQSAGLEKRASHGDWGSGDYYDAIAQMYGEVGYGNFSVKVGKFITPMGSDPIYSPDRFFYSLSKNFGILPVTHTGVLANFDVKNTTFHLGWVQGADRFFETSEDNAIVFGFERTLNPCTTIGYSALMGTDTYETDRDYFVNSLYLKRKLGCKWDYTFEWVLNNVDYDNGGSATAYGINNSLYYNLRCNLSFGFRAEWLHTNGWDSHNAYFLGDGNDAYGFAVGANWKPCDWFVLRPEIRYDSVHGDPGPFGVVKHGAIPAHGDQLSGGFSAVVKF